MTAEIITIGDELLIGQTVDTNSAWIGEQMSLAGFDIRRKITVHDKREDILGALGESSGRADVIIITGGLGPTSDDITKPALCEFFGTKLIFNPEVLTMIEKMMSRRNFPMNENNRKQAEVPESCRVLTNEAGTAPGMWFEKDNSIFVSMPGVPYEMKYIMNMHVLPDLKKRFTSQVIIHKNIMTYGIPEAVLSERLAEFESELPDSVRLAYLPSGGINKLRLTATGIKNEVLSAMINEQVAKLYAIIPDLIYGEDEAGLEEIIGKYLVRTGKSLCTAESCTGGNIAHMITSIPGSSRYFLGSVIPYDNRIKTGFLNIDPGIIETFGAVSEQVVRLMAENSRNLFKADYSMATSGIAGPDGGSEEKPVGTLWIAVAGDSGTVAEKFVFGTDRLANIRRFSLAALNLLRKQIISK
jgi:nicotinamide-nucleotide amidase